MAIVIHPARATRDWLEVGVRRGDRMYHVLSDRIGVDGSAELHAFVAQLGIRGHWAQYPGTYREHFDAPGRALDGLLALGGALVTNRELGTLLAAKRAAQQGGEPPEPTTDADPAQ